MWSGWSLLTRASRSTLVPPTPKQIDFVNGLVLQSHLSFCFLLYTLIFRALFYLVFLYYFVLEKLFFWDYVYLIQNHFLFLLSIIISFRYPSQFFCSFIWFLNIARKKYKYQNYFTWSFIFKIISLIVMFAEFYFFAKESHLSHTHGLLLSLLLKKRESHTNIYSMFC